jgi:hypothetical protein
MTIPFAPLLGAAALFLAAPALAQSTHHRSQQGQRVCQPLCSTDTSPCDPPEFKAADGRCAYPMLGR